jgi:hypothetical protein
MHQTLPGLMHRVAQSICLCLGVICLCAFSSYVSVLITIRDIQSPTRDMDEIRQLVHDLGYMDAEVSRPTPTKYGFRSNDREGIFLVLDFNASKGQMQISFSQGANRLSNEAMKRLAALTDSLRTRYGATEVSISEQY